MILYKSLFSFFSKKLKKEFFLTVIFHFISGLFEALGIGVIFLYLKSIASPEIFLKHEIFENFRLILEINEDNLFMLSTFFLIGFTIISVLLRLYSNYIFQMLGARTMIESALYLYSINFKRDYIDFKRDDTRMLQSQIISKTKSVASGFVFPVIRIIGSVLTSLMIIVSLFYVDFLLTLYGLGLVLVFYSLFSFKVRQVLRIYGKKINTITTKLFVFLSESLGSFKHIILSSTDDVYVKEFKDILTQHKVTAARIQFITVAPRYLFEGLVMIMVPIFLFVYLGDIEDKSQEILNIIPLAGTFLLAIQRIMPHTQQLFSSWSNIHSSRNQLIELEEVIKKYKKSSVKRIQNNRLDFKKSFSLENIGFTYKNNKSPVIENLSFKFKKGRVYGIFGESGSGKSTLLDIVLGLIRPDNGEILIDGEILGKSKKSITKNVAHIPQNIFLPNISLKKFIIYPDKEIKNEELFNKSLEITELNQLLDMNKLNLDDKMGENGALFSGGQRQRIAFAQAIYQNKSILAIDEATNALDEKSELTLLDNLKRITGLTIILISHRESLKHFCDEFIIINKKYNETH